MKTTSREEARVSESEKDCWVMITSDDAAVALLFLFTYFCFKTNSINWLQLDLFTKYMPLRNLYQIQVYLVINFEVICV